MEVEEKKVMKRYRVVTVRVNVTTTNAHCPLVAEGNIQSNMDGDDGDKPYDHINHTIVDEVICKPEDCDACDLQEYCDAGNEYYAGWVCNDCDKQKTCKIFMGHHLAFHPEVVDGAIIMVDGMKQP